MANVIKLWPEMKCASGRELGWPEDSNQSGHLDCPQKLPVINRGLESPAAVPGRVAGLKNR